MCTYLVSFVCSHMVSLKLETAKCKANIACVTNEWNKSGRLKCRQLTCDDEDWGNHKTRTMLQEVCCNSGARIYVHVLEYLYCSFSFSIPEETMNLR